MYQCIKNTMFCHNEMIAVPVYILICMCGIPVDCGDEGVLKPGYPEMKVIHFGLVPPQ